jgi:hypothetical protein
MFRAAGEAVSEDAVPCSFRDQPPLYAIGIPGLR